MNLFDVPTTEIISLRNEDFIKEFATQFYSRRSHDQVHSKLNKYVLRKIDKHFSEYTYEDYITIQSDKSNIRAKNYVSSLFKFLYFKEILKDTRFNVIFPVELIERHFAKRILEKDNGESNKETKKLSILEFDEIIKIENFLRNETDNMEILKMKLYWYLIMEENISITDIKDLKSDNYDKGQLLISDDINIIDLPNEFELLFQNLSKRKNDGFTNLNGNIKDLAEAVGIKKNLIPQMIKNTKVVNMMACSNCQESHSSILENWCAIEGKLVCKECGDSLKKIYAYQELSNSPIEIVDNYEVLESNEQDFNEKKSRVIQRGVDFKRLHEVMEEIGRLGEEHVYNLEYRKLIDTPYANRIDKTIADIHSNGYDILSYEKDGTELHIEVKATTSNNDEFYISQNELNTAERMLKNGEKYCVYFVKDILSDNPPLKVIDNILDDVSYCKIAQNWKVEIK
ncbi:DUF3883 domain-containing protein [Lysinibacillus agricola]|uniref:DUF3883 domain-containing protein n=1 Tax=Lysinibacillus agricola TaxID=2590012 RepID=UPI003C16E307